MLFVFTQLQSWPVGQLNWSMEEAATNTRRIQASKQSEHLLWQPFWPPHPPSPNPGHTIMVIKTDWLFTVIMINYQVLLCGCLLYVKLSRTLSHTLIYFDSMPLGASHWTVMVYLLKFALKLLTLLKYRAIVTEVVEFSPIPSVVSAWTV